MIQKKQNPVVHVVTVGTSLLQNSKSAVEKTLSTLADQLEKFDTSQKAIDNNRLCGVLGQFTTAPSFPMQVCFDKRPANDGNCKYADAYEQLKGYSVQTMLKRRLRLSSKDRDLLPAELSYVFRHYDYHDYHDYLENMGRSSESFPQDIVYLLASHTVSSLFCACCIKKYIEEDDDFLGKRIKKALLDYVPGLQVHDKTRFEEKGLFELSEKVAMIVDEYKKSHEILINLTGGFKGCIPYLTMMGMCYAEASLEYLFEDCKDIISIPLLPVDFDLLARNEYRAIIRIIPHTNAENVEGLVKSLPPKLRTMFSKIQQDGKYPFSSIGRIIEKRFPEAQAHIARFGTGEVALTLFRNPIAPEEWKNAAGKWEEDLRNRFACAQYIWLGDNIPETVEHGRGHCQRLLEMAVQLLQPVLSKVPDFLSPEEIYVLLYTLWIHDIGHSGRKIDFQRDGKNVDVDVSHFPSLVRDLHHELAYEMIEEDPEYIGFTQDDLNKDGDLNILFKAINILFKAIRTSYRYHRGKAPLEKGEGHYHWKVIDKPVRQVGKQMGLQLCSGRPFRLELITAIQRVLDVCDNQRERVVDTEFQDRRLRLTDRQIQTENARLNELTAMIEYEINRDPSCDSFKFGILCKWWKYLRMISNKWKNKEEIPSDNLCGIIECRKILGENLIPVESHPQGKDPIIMLQRSTKMPRHEVGNGILGAVKEFEALILKLIQRIWTKEDEVSEPCKQYYRLLKEWLSCCDNVLFKMIQESHFAKHASVDAVFVKLTSIENNDFHFSIVLELAESKTFCDPEVKWYVEEKIINEDIREEVMKCQSLLQTDSARIIIDGYEIYNNRDFTKPVGVGLLSQL